jgi:hypothetical protein
MKEASRIEQIRSRRSILELVWPSHQSGGSQDILRDKQRYKEQGTCNGGLKGEWSAGMTGS